VAQGKEWLEGIEPGVEECKAREAISRRKGPKVNYREAQKLPGSGVGSERGPGVTPSPRARRPAVATRLSGGPLSPIIPHRGGHDEWRRQEKRAGSFPIQDPGPWPSEEGS
jgi:hypothetical protein